MQHSLPTLGMICSTPCLLQRVLLSNRVTRRLPTLATNASPELLLLIFNSATNVSPELFPKNSLPTSFPEAALNRDDPPHYKAVPSQSWCSDPTPPSCDHVPCDVDAIVMIWPFGQNGRDTVKFFIIPVEVLDAQHPICLVRDAENVNNVAAV